MMIFGYTNLLSKPETKGLVVLINKKRIINIMTSGLCNQITKNKYV